jgi:hypothetical protein
MLYETPVGQVIDASYYNMFYTNTTTGWLPLKFIANLNVPFISKCSDYNLSVARFVIPNQDTPLIYFKSNSYKITMTYSTFSASQYVIYTPRASNVTNQPVYEMQHWIDMLNTALTACYTALNILVTLPVGSAPYFVYDNVTELISLVALKGYASTEVAPINIYMNVSLYQKIGGFPTIETGISDKEFLLYISNTLDNEYSTSYYKMTQQAPSIDNMIDFIGLVFTTSIPIKSEYIGTDINNPILTDYSVLDVNMHTYNNDVVYAAATPYRQTQLLSDAPLQQFSIDVWWQTNDGSLHPISVAPNKSANIKLMFLKKK